VPGAQLVAQPLESGIVIEQDAEQSLLGLHVGRRVGDLGRRGRTQIEHGNEGHG